MFTNAHKELEVSRSRKKVWGYTDQQSRSKRKGKKFANKTVRQHKKEIPNGMAYKKLYCSWNICDWKWIFFDRRELEDKEFYLEDWKYYSK